MLLWTALKNWWQRSVRPTEVLAEPEVLESGLPRFVHNDEPLARFLTQSNHFSTQKKIAKPAAFLPNKKGKTSVCRHGEEPRKQLWQFGREYLGEGCSLYGATVFAAHNVRAEKLDTVPEEPPLRHANIVGWPSDSDPEEEKARRKERALALAACATLVMMEDD